MMQYNCEVNDCLKIATERAGYCTDHLITGAGGKIDPHFKTLTPEYRKKRTYSHMIKLFVGFLQIFTSILGLTEVPWPPTLKEYLYLFTFVNIIEYPLETFECATQLSYYHKLGIWSLLFPLLLLAAMIIAALVMLINKKICQITIKAGIVATILFQY
eukprot:TRINITY_DN1269_c0_g1_i1.p1 TRINITY_DN1269_c0_g1~~TRINITY_DN1269_c0_g1_i1.p1  ORF type:complete len:158 (-),score=10.93 TRINITY_DN1269_c0_g1_i1:744-1217(-)